VSRLLEVEFGLVLQLLCLRKCGTVWRTCTQARRPTGDLGLISTERRPYILRQGAQDILQTEHVKPPKEQPAARHCQQQTRQMPRARRERVRDDRVKEIGI